MQIKKFVILFFTLITCPSCFNTLEQTHFKHIEICDIDTFPVEKDDLLISRSFGVGELKVKNTTLKPRKIIINGNDSVLLANDSIHLGSYFNNNNCLDIAYKKPLW